MGTLKEEKRVAAALSAALPSTANRGDDGQIVTQLAISLDQFRKATARRQQRG